MLFTEQRANKKVNEEGLENAWAVGKNGVVRWGEGKECLKEQGEGACVGAKGKTCGADE